MTIDLTVLASAADAHASLALGYARSGNVRSADIHRRRASEYLDIIHGIHEDTTGAEDTLALLDDRVHPDGAPAAPPAGDDEAPAPRSWAPPWALDWITAHVDADPWLMLTAHQGMGIAMALDRLDPAAPGDYLDRLGRARETTSPGVPGSAEDILYDALTSAVESLTAGSLMAAHERRRQIDDEGYTPDHDLIHEPGQLARAAGCYMLAADSAHPDAIPVPSAWPWEPESWKPSPDRARNLTKAAALVIAELDVTLAGTAPHPPAAPDVPVPAAAYDGEEPF